MHRFRHLLKSVHISLEISRQRLYNCATGNLLHRKSDALFVCLFVCLVSERPRQQLGMPYADAIGFVLSLNGFFSTEFHLDKEKKVFCSSCLLNLSTNQIIRFLSHPIIPDGFDGEGLPKSTILALEFMTLSSINFIVE